jgi:hypothetical protein
VTARGIGIGVGAAGDLVGSQNGDGDADNARDITRPTHAPRGTPAPRVSARHVAELADQLGPRDWDILGTVHRLRLVTGLQLERLHFAELTGKSRSVSRWRVLKRLTDWRVLVPLARRIGGAARGSAGAVYALDSAGSRLLRLRHTGLVHGRRQRRPSVPGVQKAAHSLATSELYVALVEQARVHGFEIVRFEVEPHYQSGSGWLSPDAYAVLARDGVADHWWVEVDLATESAATVRRKLEAYATYYQQGRWASLGTMPRVLITVPDEQRGGQLARTFPQRAQEIARIVQHRTAADYMRLTITNVDS